jgi:hypothetical protein
MTNQINVQFRLYSFCDFSGFDDYFILKFTLQSIIFE